MRQPKFFVVLFLISTLFIHSAKTNDNQQVFTPDIDNFYGHEDILNLFCSPINFTRSGIRCYLRHVFNREEYCQDFLPHNLNHVIEFIQYGKETDQDIVYMQSIIRLFNNKLKSSHYVTNFAFSDMIDKLPDLIQQYCTPESENLIEYFKKSIKTILYNTFLNKFTAFKEKPDEVFDEVSEEIIDTVGKEVTREQFRQLIIRFLETALNKITWCPVADEDVWKSVKQIAQKLSVFREKAIIDEDELDDLFKSLLEQFCHFLELSGSDLSLDVINEIKDDIASGKLSLLELDEQEEHIETKKSRLTRSIMHTEAKIHARQRGVITEEIVY